MSNDNQRQQLIDRLKEMCRMDPDHAPPHFHVRTPEGDSLSICAR